MVFAFLFGLSMDYEVFILARIREEYDRTGDDRRRRRRGDRAHRPPGHERRADPVPGVRRHSLRARAPTSRPLPPALGFGILLDATIVRSMLVPALVSMFGSWNWWLPGWAARVLRVRESSAHPVTVGTDG